MQLLKQIPKYATFPLILSITCYLIEAMVSFFNPDVTTPHWQINNLSLEPHNSLIISLLKNLQGTYDKFLHSYFDFMRMMSLLHIDAIMIRFSQKCLAAQKSSIISPEPQEFVTMTNSKKYLRKTLRCLIYDTVSFYLCPFVIGTLDSSRLILVQAKNMPEDDLILDHLLTIARMRGAASRVISQDGETIFQTHELKEKIFFWKNIPRFSGLIILEFT